MSDDRRDFFKKVAGAAVSLAAAEAILDGAGLSATAAAADKRAYTSAHFALELDGLAGLLESVEGGEATADVIEEQPAGGVCFARKHIGNVKYEEIAISCGPGMSAEFYAWIQGSLGCDHVRKNGAVVVTDFKFIEVARRSFTEALITEFGMPALDAASKDAARMTVKLAPEVTRREKGSGTVVVPCGGAKTQKRWLPSNFRLTVDGLDCTKVSRIDAITIKLSAGNVGDGRDGTRRIEFPNLVVTLAESHAQSFYDWHEDFVIKGNNSSEEEKSGKLEYLAPNLQEVLFTLDLHGLGIFKLTPDSAEAGADQVRRVKAEMYCEQMARSFGKTPC